MRRSRVRCARRSPRQLAHPRATGFEIAYPTWFALTGNVKPQVNEADILSIERPDHALWTYYALRCLVIPPLFPILVLPAYFRYHTMRYTFNEEGISMRWGILFRHEIILNYARIQDIHLRANLIERWLGLARVQIQTASGSAAAEMTIEGLKQFEAVRDFLYSRMRGVKDAAHRQPALPPAARELAPVLDGEAVSELTATLREVTRELRALHEALAVHSASGQEGDGHV